MREPRRCARAVRQHSPKPCCVEHPARRRENEPLGTAISVALSAAALALRLRSTGTPRSPAGVCGRPPTCPTLTGAKFLACRHFSICAPSSYRRGCPLWAPGRQCRPPCGVGMKQRTVIIDRPRRPPSMLGISWPPRLDIAPASFLVAALSISRVTGPGRRFVRARPCGTPRRLNPAPHKAGFDSVYHCAVPHRRVLQMPRHQAARISRSHVPPKFANMLSNFFPQASRTTELSAGRL